MSLPTSLQETEPWTHEAPARMRTRRKRRITRRGWIAFGALIAILLTAGGGVLAFENALPTSVNLNLKNGDQDVPTYTRLVFSFSRPVALSAIQSALSITPATDGTLADVSAQKQYTWSPAKALADLTVYTVTLGPITDTSHHRIPGGRWTFTTNIVPRIMTVTAGATALTDGVEIDPGTPLTVNFNDAMEPITIKVTIGTQQADLKWAADFRSATISTQGFPTGPLVLQMGPGGRDQTGHHVPGTFTLKSGMYYHDHEHRTPLRFPALIQVPNDYYARDQNGLQAADVVFEYLAEGGITRCTAIFQNAPDLIGPMRSSRFISLKIARHYRGLLFQSGESAATRARAASDPVPQFFDTIGYTYRTDARNAPDNLMINASGVVAAENLYSGIPTFTLPKARPDLSGGGGGTPVPVDEHYSVYTYDPGTGTYQKSEEGHAYQDASLHQPLRIEMLIVFHTAERLVNVGDGHGAHIHDFDMDSGGRVQIYYKGLGYNGSWASPDGHGPLSFTLDSGQAVTLPPGLVWVDVVA
ncbi:MAG: hypothetical protein AUJ02_06965 [Chloroflexi bacterium 13_1_40CM_3_65_12]|nr:MAG: hypothetical protein AUH40_05270 [Chloroflexi bacterium 13_1_40CM_65_17]OLD24842.1 MAG: hypothetical protein AUJ02_06965 [Chloroflexi bacterium 13_1_40CM_3_65_12]OLD50040.1 MAG: hypothetical protein AUI42_04965 [Actinobacteria bacterium 13_1_40CM_2_65_8]